MMWGYYDGWSWIWMASTMVVFWGALIGVAIWAVRAFTRPRQDGDPAIAALRQRLATGQIGQDEYERIRKVIQGS